MGIKVIHTSDGDKLRDVKTNRLAGSAPRKPRAPKAKTNDTEKLIEYSRSKSSEEIDFISKAAQKFKVKKEVFKAKELHTRQETFWRYGDDGNESPKIMAEVVHKHILSNHPKYSSQDPVDFMDNSPADSIYDAVEDWHRELHNRELIDFLANPELNENLHYHANDLSEDPDIRWIPVSELLTYGIYPDEHELGEDSKKLLNRKLFEAKENGLYNLTRVYGVLEPIIIAYEYEEYADEEADKVESKMFISDGYHRMVSASDVDPNMLVPIKDRDW